MATHLVPSSAVLADPAGLLGSSAVQAIQRAAAALLGAAGVDLRIIALPRLDRGHVTAMLDDALPGGSLASQFAGSGLHDLGAAVDQLFLEANRSHAFQRGGVVRLRLPERFGLAPLSPSRPALAVLLSARERYIAVEATTRAAAHRLQIPRWLTRARGAGRAAAIEIPSLLSGPAQLLPQHQADFAALAGSVRTSLSASWSTKVVTELMSAATWSARLMVVRRSLLYLAAAGFVVVMTRDVHKQMCELWATQERYAAWLALVARLRRGEQLGHGGTECMICLGTLHFGTGGDAGESLSPRRGGTTTTGLSRAANAGSQSQLAGGADDAQEVVVCACAHVFHRDCAARWLAAHNTCPLCRAVDPLPAAPPPGFAEFCAAEESKAAVLATGDGSLAGETDDGAAVAPPPRSLAAAVRKRPLAALRAVLTLLWVRLMGYGRATVEFLRGLSVRERLLVARLLLHEWPSLISALVTVWRLAPRIFSSRNQRAAESMSRLLPGLGVTLFETFA